MELLHFLREEPVMAWFALLALLLTIVPMAVFLWQRLNARKQIDTAKQPSLHSKPVRFGNHAELIILFFGLIFLLSMVSILFK